MLWLVETAAGCKKAISNNNTIRSLVDGATYSLLKNDTHCHTSITLYIPTAKEVTNTDQYIIRYYQFYVQSEGQNKSMQLVP